MSANTDQSYVYQGFDTDYSYGSWWQSSTSGNTWLQAAFKFTGQLCKIRVAKNPNNVVNTAYGPGHEVS